ncbi:hypothetical protein R1flu_010798 [Riccia fluitans]|uniref:Uncharacterized protein n=1 Tax=Riccia fluitans TaxID=41844 RepID=A0ABD1Z5Z5_9MARC
MSDDCPFHFRVTREALYDHLNTFEVEDLCDLYQKLIMDNIGREDDLDLEDALYEIEQLLLSTKDGIIIEVVLENYPNGFSEERSIASPTYAPYILSPYVLDLCHELGILALVLDSDSDIESDFDSGSDSDTESDYEAALAPATAPVA